MEAHEKAQLTAFAAQIADVLGETAEKPRSKIRRITYVLGPKRVHVFVQQALEVEANGGMWFEKQQRQRTLGGVFFRLVRDQISDTERAAIWPPIQPKPTISSFWMKVATGKPLSSVWRTKDWQVGIDHAEELTEYDELVLRSLELAR